MSFQEKSAWVLSITLIIGGIFYFFTVQSLSSELGELAPPVMPVLVVYTGIIIVLAVIGHIVLAVFAHKDANVPLDERERKIIDKAGHLSCYVFAVGVVLSLGAYVFFYNGNLLFYGVFGSLMLSQLAEYFVQIYLYRSVF